MEHFIRCTICYVWDSTFLAKFGFLYILLLDWVTSGVRTHTLSTNLIANTQCQHPCPVFPQRWLPFDHFVNSSLFISNEINAEYQLELLPIGIRAALKSYIMTIPCCFRYYVLNVSETLETSMTHFTQTNGTIHGLHYLQCFPRSPGNSVLLHMDLCYFCQLWATVCVLKSWRWYKLSIRLHSNFLYSVRMTTYVLVLTRR